MIGFNFSNNQSGDSAFLIDEKIQAACMGNDPKKLHYRDSKEIKNTWEVHPAVVWGSVSVQRGLAATLPEHYLPPSTGEKNCN